MHQLWWVIGHKRALDIPRYFFFAFHRKDFYISKGELKYNSFKYWWHRSVSFAYSIFFKKSRMMISGKIFINISTFCLLVLSNINYWFHFNQTRIFITTPSIQMYVNWNVCALRIEWCDTVCTTEYHSIEVYRFPNIVSVRNCFTCSKYRIEDTIWHHI